MTIPTPVVTIPTPLPSVSLPPVTSPTLSPNPAPSPGTTLPQATPPPATAQLSGQPAPLPTAAAVGDTSSTVAPPMSADADLQRDRAKRRTSVPEHAHDSANSARQRNPDEAISTEDRTGRLHPTESQFCAEPEALVPWLRELICPTAPPPSPDVASAGPIPILGSNAAALAAAALAVLGAGIALAVGPCQGRDATASDATTTACGGEWSRRRARWLSRFGR